MKVGLTSQDIAQGIALIDFLKSGQTLGTIMGCSLEVQEAIYHRGHTLYNQAKYDDAMRVFAYLMMANHVDRRYYIGFAACLQMQRRYTDAIKYYGVASVLKLTDPEPPMHMAECHLALGDAAQAATALDYAITQARAHEEHHGLVPRLEAMQAFLGNDQKESTYARAETASSEA
jgi:type III secretion system low calcium response chaperone LcrH/SycD